MSNRLKRPLWKKLLFILPLTLITIIVFRIIGVYTYIRVSNNSMSPTIIPGTRLFGLCFLSINKNDIVTYAFSNSKERKRFIGRVVATEGDIIEFKNGIAFINGKIIDDTLKLDYLFKANTNDILSQYNFLVKEEKIIPIKQDTVLINCSFKYIQDAQLVSKVRRIISNIPTEFELSKKIKQSTWSIDNFGPIRLPKSAFFIVGDNRGAAIDCRQKGYVFKNDITSKIIF